MECLLQPQHWVPEPTSRAHSRLDSPQQQAHWGKDQGQGWRDWHGSSLDLAVFLMQATQPTLKFSFLICKRKTKSLAGIVNRAQVLDPVRYRRVTVLYVNGHWP